MPITDELATERRFGSVFDRVRKGNDLFLRVVAHPPGRTRRVYQRATSALTAGFLDQERNH